MSLHLTHDDLIEFDVRPIDFEVSSFDFDPNKYITPLLGHRKMSGSVRTSGWVPCLPGRSIDRRMYRPDRFCNGARKGGRVAKRELVVATGRGSHFDHCNPADLVEFGQRQELDVVTRPTS